MFARAIIRDNQDRTVCLFSKESAIRITESESWSVAVNESRFFKRLRVTTSFLASTVIMAEDSSIYSTVGERSKRAVSLATLHSHQVRFVYLITYSQADLDLVPTREEFLANVLDSFSNADPSSPVEVVQWACSKEEHRDSGSHYHMAVKLSARHRLLKAKSSQLFRTKAWRENIF